MGFEEGSTPASKRRERDETDPADGNKQKNQVESGKSWLTYKQPRN